MKRMVGIKRILLSEQQRLSQSDVYFEESCRRELFRRAFHALKFNQIDGDYAEFGCEGGMTFNLAFQESRKLKYDCKLWAFDSFAGLPAKESLADDHPGWIEGSFYMTVNRFHEICRRNGILRSQYEVVEGFYKDSLLHRHLPGTGHFSFAYIDCDLYSSARTVLEFLLPHLKHGMVLAFDDYYCWSKTQLSGERRAACEVFGTNKDWRLVPFVQFGWHGMSFLLESKRIVDLPEIHGW